MPRIATSSGSFVYFLIVGVLGELPVLGPFFPLCLPVFQSDYLKAIGLAIKCIFSFLGAMIAMHLIFKDEKHFDMQKLQDEFSNMGIMLIGMTFGKIAFNFLNYMIYGIDNMITDTPTYPLGDIEIAHENTGIRPSRAIIFSNQHVENQESIELITNNQTPSSENNDSDDANQSASSQTSRIASCTLLN